MSKASLSKILLNELFNYITHLVFVIHDGGWAAWALVTSCY